MENLQTKISLFRSLFKGREDVFATRWEKDKKEAICLLTFSILTVSVPIK